MPAVAAYIYNGGSIYLICRAAAVTAKCVKCPRVYHDARARVGCLSAGLTCTADLVKLSPISSVTTMKGDMLFVSLLHLPE